MTLVLAILVCFVIALMPISVVKLVRGPRGTVGWALLLSVGSAFIAALVTWGVCSVKAGEWKMRQSMHIRLNVEEFSDQYGRIDKLGNEDLRRAYVTNFCYNACILLNLDCKTAPNTSNIVAQYYYDWDKRISNAERVASEAEVNK